MKRVGYSLLAVAFALLGVQLNIDLGTRLAPGDVALAAGILVLLGEVTIPRRVVYRCATVVWVTAIGATMGFARGHFSVAYAGRAVGVLVLSGYLVAGFLLARQRSAIYVIRLLVLGIAGTVIIGLAEQRWSLLSSSGVPVDVNQVERFSALLIDANNAGLAIALAFVLLVSAPGLVNSTLIRVSVGVLLIYGLLLTGSRTGLAAAVAGGVTWIAAPLARRRSGPGVIALAVVGLVGFGAYISRVLLSRTKNLGAWHDRPDTVSQRAELASASLDTFMDNPIFGAGLGGVQASAGEIPHATILWVLGDLGLVGLLVYTAVLLWPSARATVVASSRGSSRIVRALAAGLAVMLVGSLSIEASFQRSWWVLIGVWQVLEPVSPDRGPSTSSTHQRSASVGEAFGDREYIEEP